jgi:hypothetical protein
MSAIKKRERTKVREEKEERMERRLTVWTSSQIRRMLCFLQRAAILAR